MWARADAALAPAAVSTAQSPETMLIVGIVVGSLALVMGLLLLLARSRLRTAYHVKRQ